MGVKEIWQQECKKAFDARDWDKLWQVMYAGALGANFAGRPVASLFLARFLEKGGNLRWDYTDLINLPIEPGNAGRWIKNTPSVKNIVSKLDTEARAKIMSQVNSGIKSGTVKNSYLVVTKGEVDNDCYYAIGKFILNGEYKFTVESDIWGKRYVKMERVYWLQEDYDWTPGAKGGILPHDYPIALITAGKAAVYNYYIKFGEPEYKIPF